MNILELKQALEAELAKGILETTEVEVMTDSCFLKQTRELKWVYAKLEERSALVLKAV